MEFQCIVEFGIRILMQNGMPVHNTILMSQNSEMKWNFDVSEFQCFVILMHWNSIA